MTTFTRRSMLSATMGAGAALVGITETQANPGISMPPWGETGGTTSLAGGVLGTNPALDPGQVPMSIRIPDAGVDAEIERQVIVDQQMLDPSGPWVVAWYEQTGRTGAVGNCVMAGHVDYWDVGPSVFHDLAEVPTGARIEVTGRNGAVYTYAVTSIDRWDITTLTVDELNSPEMVGTTDYPALTLITCGGDFNGEEYTERDLVRAELIASRPAAS